MWLMASTRIMTLVEMLEQKDLLVISVPTFFQTGTGKTTTIVGVLSVILNASVRKDKLWKDGGKDSTLSTSTPPTAVSRSSVSGLCGHRFLLLSQSDVFVVSQCCCVLIAIHGCWRLSIVWS